MLITNKYIIYLTATYNKGNIHKFASLGKGAWSYGKEGVQLKFKFA